VEGIDTKQIMNTTTTVQYFQTMGSCRKDIFDKMEASQPKTLSLTKTDQITSSCLTDTYITAIVLASLGIICNVVNIITFTKKILKREKEPILLFLAMAVSDLILLLIQLPYLISTLHHDKHITTDMEKVYTKYVIVR